MKIKNILFLLTCMFIVVGFYELSAQERNITGTVTASSDGMPLPGVSIVVKGTLKGTETDFDGNYTIAAPSNSVLVFSYVGMSTVERKIAASTKVDVAMNEDTLIGEVIVTALGLEKKKDKDLSSASVVKVEEITKSGEAGVLQSLAGKTSGVNVTKSSGDPGAGAHIQLRGQNTVLGSSGPLIVLDGQIISNSSFGSGTGGVVQQSRLNDLNQEDIESVTVLKGASSAAIYGTDAANGVIVIRTKRGRGAGKDWKVNFNTSISMDQINREWDKQEKFGQGTGGNYSPTSGYSFGDKISARAGGADKDDMSGSSWVADNGNVYYPIASGGKNSKNTYNQENRDAVFRNALSLSSNVSLTYGTEKVKTFISFSKLSQEGIYNGNSNYDRSTIRMNTDYKFADWLDISLSTQYTGINSNRIQTGSNLNGLYLGYLRTSPDYDIRDYKGTYYDKNGVATFNSHRSYRRPTGSYRSFSQSSEVFSYVTPSYNNPLWTLNEQLNKSKVSRFIISPQFIFHLNDNLDLNFRYGLDTHVDDRINHWPVGSAGDGNNGLFRDRRYKETIEQFNIFANGSYDISENFALSTVIGLDLYERNYNRLEVEETSFTNPDETFLKVENASTLNASPDGFISRKRKIGGYFVLNMDLWTNFLVEISGRGERVSNLPNAGLIFYPSASLGYDFTEMFNESDVLSFGKLRATWGQVGVDAVEYASQTVYTNGGAPAGWGEDLEASIYGNPLQQGSRKGNSALKEERKTEVELGFDIRLFNNKVSLSATYYDNKTEDGLLELPISSATGFTTQYVNASTITNKGLEIDFGYNIFRNEDWVVRASANFTKNKSLVESMGGGAPYNLNGFTSGGAWVAEGQPYSVLRGGAFERNEDGTLALNSNGFPNAADSQQFVGDPNPDWRGGFSLNASWKNFNFSAFVETSQGNDVWNGTLGVLKNFGIAPETAVETVAPSDLKNYGGDIIKAGDTFRGYIHDFGNGPVAIDEDWFRSIGGGFAGITEQFIEDGSFTKLREISVSYNLPKNILESLKLDSMQVGISGRNLFTWTDVTGYDPESNLTGASKGRGLEYFSNPGSRSVIFTLGLSF